MLSEEKVKQVFPDAQAVWTSRGWRVLSEEGEVLIGKTNSPLDPEAYAWDEAWLSIQGMAKESSDAK